jgi:hypothetical protein
MGGMSAAAGWMGQSRLWWALGGDAAILSILLALICCPCPENRFGLRVIIDPTWARPEEA